MKQKKSNRYLGNWKQITHPAYLPFCPSSVLLFRFHSLLCALHNKTEDKQKYFAKWVGYLFPITLNALTDAPIQGLYYVAYH